MTSTTITTHQLAQLLAEHAAAVRHVEPDHTEGFAALKATQLENLAEAIRSGALVVR